MLKIVLATKNRGKAKEIRRILEGLAVEVTTLSQLPPFEMPPEEGETFGENALIKARFVAEKTGCAVLADDSGLVVDYLGGRPGVYSSRYAGDGASDEDNWRKLLNELEGVGTEDRTARFVCVLAYVEPGGVEATFEGVLEGKIAAAPSGVGGFGYDPVFFLPDRGKTIAELIPDEKNRISHRARALGKFKRWLSECGKA